MLFNNVALTFIESFRRDLFYFKMILFFKKLKNYFTYGIFEHPIKNELESVDNLINELDNLSYQLEKFADEHKDKLSEDDKSEADSLCKEAKEILEKSDTSVTILKENTEKVISLLQKLGGQVQQQEQANQQTQSNPNTETQSEEKEDVVDADFEVVDDKE